MIKGTREERNASLNKMYRDEGWGGITDEALGIEPVDVESQARIVAEWAFDQIKERDALIHDMCGHEGAEGFSAHTHVALDKWDESQKKLNTLKDEKEAA